MNNSGNISKLKKLLLLLIITFSSMSLVAQDESANECAFTLIEAQDLFAQGDLEEIPTKLADCINDGFTKEERLQAYKLIIQSFLFQDKIKESDSVMLQFLKKNHEYEIVPTDPMEFQYLYNSFRTEPIFSIVPFFGANFSNTRITQLFGLKI